MNIQDPIALFLGSWSIELNLYSVLFRTMVAVIFAAILGCERATKRHAAGLRTFMLVSLATSMAVMLDTFICVNNSFTLPLISASTMIGIAIISSNTLIFSSKNQIKGHPGGCPYMKDTQKRRRELGAVLFRIISPQP